MTEKTIKEKQTEIENKLLDKINTYSEKDVQMTHEWVVIYLDFIKACHNSKDLNNYFD